MYDVIVIGGGHAGNEAAIASAKLNHSTLLITGNLKMVSFMPCNPSIGGPAKGTLVREIDALGGVMGIIADKTTLQMKMLNKSKGPAVRALRAQSDKLEYPREMLKLLMNTDNLDLKEAYVKELLVENNKVYGVKLETGEEILSKSVIITTGTFMNAKIMVGDFSKTEGPDKQKASIGLSDHLRALGHDTYRLKTGTPARIKRDSIDFSKMELSPGDGFIHHFSFEKEHLRVLDKEWPCYLIHTQAKTHEIIHFNLNKSAMYGGQTVDGVGPRYCPSIEDKLVRFADKERHQLFIEPESREIDEVYLQGFSTSMPYDVQEEMIHSLPGLENAVISKYAYAIEYDAIDSRTLWPSLESKIIENLFFAGQVNGTSGYEEAAAQGLMAGINASLKLQGKEAFILRRDQAYIGVLIDDLVTKGTKEPYRMLTSRAEFRLLLRHDNADMRLTRYGYQLGLINENRYQNFLEKKKNIEMAIQTLLDNDITPTEEVRDYLEKNNLMGIKGKTTLFDLLKRQDMSIDIIEDLAHIDLSLSEEEAEQVDIYSKYDGYIKKAINQAEKLQKEHNIKIPTDIDYFKVNNLALEARDKLNKIRPLTISQASRISGVNPADIQMLLIHLKKYET
ncbi:tRNA uridine-5-carboxymethylaminomethyl(34) synthesis enzyme MnmG [Hujiaoplasma nucleasis]|uniref:tRNA uridine 5-carboxymethylaminomethyl modification enzyme MnmG n=1 Tax=Hujiaoplasma nucleasis TaxID=2725268 RepID=A0A7L6N544_9MOLU|nr:tRNA uridine-5-carboxymethylaminomethyl(34) synthesis enzyme MnmG [Hujiaoplasma nucleasis]QLY40397.1 tRNA uridine-5-carboxymethylaminomethyl(34) synthesis enzyme MnmG [Hujiaoplasma nucleasis]